MRMRGLVLILAACAAPALAENTTEVSQTGAQNLAVIDQAGHENTAGNLARPLTQNGFFNEIAIGQGGDGNRIGLAPGGVLQRAPAGTVSISNRIGITQGSDNNSVGAVLQDAQGAALIGANQLDVVQEGGDGNRIGQVWQTVAPGALGQSARIEQTGERNRLALVQQLSVSDWNNRGNAIEVFVSGHYNGRGALRGYAAETRAVGGHLVQTTGTEDLQGNGNSMSLVIQGDNNDFGVRQAGRENRAGLVTITGNGNALGIDQDGFENDVMLALIAGDGNEIGLIQLGTNIAELSLLGHSDDNRVRIDQMGTNDAAVTITGHRNDVTVAQGYHAGLAGTNRAEITVSGSDNLGRLVQEGGNSFTLRIAGDSNNNRGTGFSSVVGAAAFEPGLAVQRGDGNRFEGTVTGDRNLVGLFQTGGLNAILLTVTGNDNEARFLQSGSGNSADLTQTGRGNTAIFLQ